MKVIIPVKSNSTRIEEKNFKLFYKNQSLCDLQIEKILKILHPDDIYMSTENIYYKKIADKWGINFLLRDKLLTYNETPIIDVIRGISSQVDSDDEIMWCQVIDPLFDEYEECINVWNNLDKSKYDSLVVVYPKKNYMLNENFIPIGFGFGEKHLISQKLPNMYQITFVMSILSREAINKVGYYVGSKPYWYEAKNIPLDIDLEEDWELGSILYNYYINKSK